MKRIITTLLVMLGLCHALHGQKTESNQSKSEIQLLKIYNYKGYGLFNETTNDTLLKCTYDMIEIGENRQTILVGKDGKYGAMNIKGETIIPMQYASISDQGNFIMVITENKLFGLYDQMGKIIIPLDYAFLGTISEGKIRANKGGVAYFYNNGIFSNENVEVTGGDWFFLDTLGKQINYQTLTYARDFKNGIAQVYIGGSNDDWVYNGKWTYLKSDGKLLMKEATTVSPPIDGLFVVTSDKPFGIKNTRRFIQKNESPYVGVLDSKGNIILPSKYNDVKIFSDHIIECTYTTKDKEGEETFHTEWLNNKGENSFNFEVDKVKNEGNVVHVLTNGLWGIFDLQAKEMIAPKYASINNFEYLENKPEESGFIIEQNTAEGRKYGLLKKNGEVLVEPNKDTIWGHSVFFTKQDASHSIYSNGKKLFKIDCDSLFLLNTRVFPQSLVLVETPTQSVVYNAAGEKLFDYKGMKIIHATEIVQKELNVFVGVKEGKQGLIRLDGEVLIPFKFDRLVHWTTYEDHYDMLQYSYKENLMEATYQGKKTIINREGEVLLPPIKEDFRFGNISSYAWDNNRILISEIDLDDWQNSNSYGAIDTLGNVISYPKWRSIFYLPNDYYIAVPHGDYSYNIIKNGEDSILHRFESISTGKEFILQNITGINYKDSLLFVKQNDKWYILNTYSLTFSSRGFNHLYNENFYCDLSRVSIDGLIGIIDRRGNYLIEPKYEELERRQACTISDYHTKNGQEYAAKLNGKWGGITTKGKKLTEFIYNTADEIWKSDGDFFKN